MRGIVRFYSTKRNLAKLSRLWDRMRAYVDADHTAGEAGSDEDFLALKREIGRAMVALESDFGSSRLNREAENAAARIRHFLGQLPTLQSLHDVLTRDQQNLQKSWHAVFLILAELSGARYKLRSGPSPAPASSYAASPMSGEPRRRSSSMPVFRFVGSIVRIVMTLVMIVAVLAIVLFLTESAGFFGNRDAKTGAWIQPSNPILAQIGTFWQGFRAWAATNLAFISAPLAGFYATHPDIAVVLLVAILGIFVGYLIFIRAR